MLNITFISCICYVSNITCITCICYVLDITFICYDLNKTLISCFKHNFITFICYALNKTFICYVLNITFICYVLNITFTCYVLYITFICYLSYNLILQKSVISRGTGMQVIYPWFLFFDNSDNILISDTVSNSILIFSSQFQFFLKISVSTYPMGVTVDAQGRLIVVSQSDTNCLQIY